MNIFFSKFLTRTSTHPYTKTKTKNILPKKKTKICRFTPYNQQIGNYNSYRSPMSSPPRTKRDIPPRLPTKKQRSQSLIPLQPGQTMTACSIIRTDPSDKYCSIDGVVQGKYRQQQKYFFSSFRFAFN